ncbi:uncharacterized protein LOC100830796 [Brachypodium distachyon]|uniref:Uncharacterized protein n=1 Tax=Brachypodium distachyon TaxID=15368 RepID=I1H8D8_BRADI|nr:uncharacterized protein LOC100830796 [Brachypodium distachyon]KQK23020.1 hypothetical protein BRADI_1g70780v3 [Brachypodium distachyon]|eukprot:XP_003561923.1 uncharacterized protein LOC100830796 [Brachypodium distachyon]
MGHWWDRVVLPVRRVWLGVASRFGVRQSGLWRLRQEVSTCEYEDVQVMWEMLSRTTPAPPATARPRAHSRFRQPRPWAGRLRLCRDT